MHTSDLPLGIIGGSFDPFHNGHLRMGILSDDAFPFSAIHYLPCRTPVHKAETGASAEVRVAMLREALASYPKFVVDTTEVDRETPSYMIETLRTLRIRYPEQSLVLILGTDAFSGLPKWYEADQLCRYCHLLVFPRWQAVSVDAEAIVRSCRFDPTQDFTDILHSSAGRVLFQDAPLLPIASSDIRTLYQQGKRADGLIPETVRMEIARRGVYPAHR